MKSDKLYADWKKELCIWQATNAALGVEGKVQAGMLFGSLSTAKDDVPYKTVLNELTVEEISSEDGVKNIIRILDQYYIGNETQMAFSNIDDLMRFKCKPGTSIENFLIEFQIKANNVKTSGTILSDGVLGYALLCAANLPEDKLDMVKTTCDDLSYKSVKAQLQKIGLGKSGARSKYFAASKPEADEIKIEPCFFGRKTSPNRHIHSSQSSSDDDDLNGEKVFYAGKAFSMNNREGNQKLKMNPTDKFGHVRACIYCKCVYHWLVDCPYAPRHVKNRVTNKKGQSSGYNNQNVYQDNRGSPM